MIIIPPQAALAADETTAATGGANNVLKLEVRDEGAEPAAAAAVHEAAAAVHTPVRQVQFHSQAGSTWLAGFCWHQPWPHSCDVFFFCSVMAGSGASSRGNAQRHLLLLWLLSSPARSIMRVTTAFTLQAPGKARLASPSNEGSLSYTVGDLKERLRELKLPLNGRKADLLERLKAALATDTAASPPSADAVAEEEKPQPAAAAAVEEQPDAAAPKAKRRKAAVAEKPRQKAAAAVQPDEPAAENEARKAGQGRRKRVQPGTAALGPIATAKVIADMVFGAREGMSKAEVI